jgi:hypothetical protein
MLYNYQKVGSMPTNPNVSFSVSYDAPTKFISAVVCVIFLCAIIGTRSIFVACLSGLVIALSYAYSTKSYLISEGSVFVQRLIGRVGIPLDDIREVRRAESDDFKGCIRLFGNGGLFGYYGLYRTSKLGKCNWYVTNRKNAVILITRAKTVVLSPDDENGFVAALRMAASIPDAQLIGSISSSAQAGRRTGRFAGLLGGAIGILAVLLVVGALLYSPGPPEYTLTSAGLSIHDRFYPVALRAGDIDVGNIKIVDIGADADWRVTMRTNGFANFHYRSGWFKVAGGKKVRMYRADSRNLVLLPPKGEGAPVLLEVKQPGAFIQEVRQAWR